MLLGLHLALSKAVSINIFIFSTYVSIESSNSFLVTSILCGPLGPSITTVALSLLDKIFFICSADLNSFSSIKGFSNPLFLAFLYFLSSILIISSSKRLPPKCLSPTDVMTSTFLPLTFAIVISKVPPPKSNIRTLPLTDEPGKFA